MSGSRFGSHWKSRKLRSCLTAALCRVILICACAFVLFPLLWILTASLNKSASLFTTGLIPDTLTFGNYLRLLQSTDFLPWIKNSAVACLVGSLLALIFTVTMAYAFSRFKFYGRKYGLLALVLIQMLPATATIVAIYQLCVHLSLINNLGGLILVYAGTTIPFNAWLLKGYFESIPRDLEESA